MTDISTIVAAQRAIDIKHPATDEPIGLVLTILPDTHPQIVAAQRKMLNDRMQAKGKLTAERLDENHRAMLCAAVTGWEWKGELTFEGTKPDFSQDTLRKLIDRLPWIGEQIDREVADRAEFFRRADAEAR